MPNPVVDQGRSVPWCLSLHQRIGRPKARADFAKKHAGSAVARERATRGGPSWRETAMALSVGILVDWTEDKSLLSGVPDVQPVHRLNREGRCHVFFPTSRRQS